MLNLLNNPIVILAGVILLPMIPAFLLFKLLPNTAVVSGPLQGLRIDLSGAFAAYFALVVLVIFTKNSIWDPVPVARYQVWRVSGTVTDNNGTPVVPLGAGDISLLPPSLTQSSAWFAIDFPVSPGPGGGTVYPALFIGHAGYLPVQLELDPNKKQPNSISLSFNTTTHEVQINNLRLQPLPAYKAAAPLNVQAAAVGTPLNPAGVNR